MQKVIVFGGDGFCGWPISLKLSASGYDVTIVDNLSRREIDRKLNSNSLTPITPIYHRINKWRNLTGRTIRFENIDIALHYHHLFKILGEINPHAVVHLAEQRAAPYSMKGVEEKLYTVNNNISATHNLLVALSELNIGTHVVHMGTTGSYGYGHTDDFYIPEGYVQSSLRCAKTNRKINAEILFPTDPGSVYHTTKVMDAQLFYFYNKNDDIMITDLYQGIIWGTQTDETAINEDFVNRFDYDGDYGTVLNRFIVQSVVGHPITVYGSGERMRAFIHIKDSAECVKMAIENPPDKDDRVRIINQTTEQLDLYDLAKIVSKRTGAEIRHYKNPRKEDDKNKLFMTNETLLKMGLNPKKLDNDGLSELIDTVSMYKDRVDKNKIITTSIWKKGMEVDRIGEQRKDFI